MLIPEACTTDYKVNPTALVSRFGFYPSLHSNTKDYYIHIIIKVEFRTVILIKKAYEIIVNVHMMIQRIDNK